MDLGSRSRKIPRYPPRKPGKTAARHTPARRMPGPSSPPIPHAIWCSFLPEAPVRITMAANAWATTSTPIPSWRCAPKPASRVWYFQTVHHDLWDYDVASPPLLFDVHRNGKTIPALGVGSKDRASLHPESRNRRANFRRRRALRFQPVTLQVKSLPQRSHSLSHLTRFLHKEN